MKVAAVAGEKGQAMEQGAACEGPPSPGAQAFLLQIQIGFCLWCGSKVPRVGLKGTACIFGSCCRLVTEIWIVSHIILMFLDAFWSR